MIISIGGHAGAADISTAPEPATTSEDYEPESAAGVLVRPVQRSPFVRVLLVDGFLAFPQGALGHPGDRLVADHQGLVFRPAAAFHPRPDPRADPRAPPVAEGAGDVQAAGAPPRTE